MKTILRQNIYVGGTSTGFAMVHKDKKRIIYDGSQCIVVDRDKLQTITYTEGDITIVQLDTVEELDCEIINCKEWYKLYA